MTERSDRDISEIRSLIKLLDDDDEQIFAAARDRLLQHHDTVLPFLPDVAENESITSKRITKIRETILRNVYKDQFRNIKKEPSGDFDLEEGIFLIAKQRYVGLDVNYYSALLNDYAAELKEKLSSVGDHTEILRRTIAFFTEEKGFDGNKHDYYSEQNHYINKVLESKTGIPISLSVIYLLVGKRINLPIKGIGLPGHFTLRFSFGSTNVYFDPFNGGKILSIDDCKEMVKNLGFTYTDDYLKPVSNLQILERTLRNIILSLEKKEETERIETIRQFIDSISYST
jgi:regulator of sirC expression with transglutaminase-like and TPR domain